MALLLTAGVFSPSPPAASVPRFSFSRSETLGKRHAPLALPSLSVTPASPLNPLPAGQTVYCGRGDKKTARGKRFKHSFGNARPRNKKKGRGPPPVPAPPAPPRKDKFDDGEIVKIVIDESLFS